MRKCKRVEVAVRMRPLLFQDQDTLVWAVHDQSNKIMSLPRSLRNNTSLLNEDSNFSQCKRKPSKIEQSNVYEFVYDHVFKESKNNKNVYDECCRDAVKQFLNGGFATIFMYGQTTSGKTYTMLGPNGRQGLVSYALQDIFGKGSPKMEVSYLQIYNEQMRDLLTQEGGCLKISEEGVQGLQRFTIKSAEDGLTHLEKGQKQRAYSQKSYHDHSSRSHTVFQIYAGHAVLSLVDLAGSQRLGEEECSEETAYINKSLFVLSNVIQKLANPKRNAHIPFRDSKLTRILAPSLTNGRATVVICTISPASINFAQTLSTLRFAALSRKIELKPPNQNLPDPLENATKIIHTLTQENSILKKTLQTKNTIHQAHSSFLQALINKIQDAIEAEQKQMRNWRGKATTLSQEFQANVRVLKEEYRRALINLTHNELGIQKEGVDRVIKL